MSTICNKYVAAGLSNLYGKTDHANCTVVFTVARKPVQEPLVADIAPAPEEGRREGDGRTHDNCAYNGANPGEQATSEPSQSESSDADELEDNLLPAAEALTLSFEEKRWLAMNAGAYSRPAHGASEQAQTEVGFVGEPLPAHTFVLCLASERFQTQMERWADEPATAGPGSPEPATSKASGAATTLVGGASAADGVGASAKAAGATEAAGATAEGGSAAAESCSGAAVGESEATAEADSGATTAAADATAAASGGAVLEAGVVTAEAGNAAATEAGVGATAEAGGGAAAADDGATARAGSGAPTEAAEAAAMAAGTGGQATAMAGGQAAVEIGCQTTTAEPRLAKQQNVREPPRPLELRVRLGGEEELPAALAAIKFAYTGRIEAGSVREVLRVWKQADYLQMKGCVEACVAAVREKLAAPAAAAAATVSADGASSVAGATGSAGQAPPAATARAAAGASSSGEASSGDAGSTSAAATAPPPVLELYGCAALWPDPEHEPAFAALLTEAKPQLVAHFGDALTVLNKQQLYDQMRALPAVALEALLESDDFGTDSESSVVLVLAEWMQVNYSTTDAATRRRLCGLLRLSQCSRAYLDWVLPALALDHLLHPGTPLGWLPITLQQVGCIARYRIAPKDEQRMLNHILGGLCGGSDPPETWLRTKRRRQCVPSQGLSYRFVLDKQELVEKLAGLQPGNNGRLELEPDAEDVRLGDTFQAMGLTWGLSVEYEHGSALAGLWLSTCLPAAYAVRHGECCSEVSKLVRPVAALRSSMYVQTCSGGQRGEKLLLSFSEEEAICLGKIFGAGVEVIELGTASVAAPAAVMQQQPLAAGLAERGPEQQEQGRQQGSAAEQQDQEQQRRAREATVAAQWSKYIIEGRVTVRMLMLRHDAAAMA